MSEAYKNIDEFNEYLSTKQALGFLGIERTTLYRWVNKGILSKKMIGGKNFFNRDEIKELLK